MQKKKILVLTDTLPWGHRSIAKAIYGFLKNKEKEDNLKVDLAEVKMPFSAINDLYVFMYRYLPASNKITRVAMENDILRSLFLETADSDILALKKVVNKYNPDLIISSYFFHSHSLAKWREKEGKNFKLWTVVADPWTINPISFVPEADLNLVYDQIGEKLAIKYGVKKSKILKTGWWVREEMYDQKLQSQKSKIQIKKKLGFNDERPVVFVGGGSLGTNALAKLLPALMLVKKPVGIIFNTGTDKLAYNMVEEYIKLFKNLRQTEMIQIKNLGWIENMAEVLSACDIVFGKAGPNFLFDVVASQKPFVAITHIGGQEDGNIDLIRAKKLGWIREKGNSAAEFLLEYLEKPEKFQQKLAQNIAGEANKNREGLGKILARINKDLR